MAVMRASSCCWPISCTPTGMPPTLISGTVTTGANSIELGALNTKSPVGRGASGWPGTSPDQSGAGPGQDERDRGIGQRAMARVRQLRLLAREQRGAIVVERHRLGLGERGLGARADAVRARVDMPRWYQRFSQLVMPLADGAAVGDRRLQRLDERMVGAADQA